MDYESGLATGLAISDKGTNGGGCYYPAMPMVPAYGYGYGMGGFGGGFGGAWGGDWIGLIVLAALFGWGGFGGFGGGRQGSYATQADLAAGFNNSAVLSNLNDIILQTSQGFAAVQQTLCQGFSGINATVNTVGTQINQGICNLGYTVQGAFNDVSRQIADCCCATQRALDGVNYNLATQACDIKTALATSARDIIDSQRDGTQAILGFLTNEKISALQAENATLKTQIFAEKNNDKQTAYLISQLKDPCPVPSYIVPNPNCCYTYGINGVGYGNNGGCCGGGF